MRGLAAFAVAVSHLDIVGIHIVAAGHLAVDFFFALSGLVIGLAYQDRLHDRRAITAFVRRRAIRLWPLYLAGTSIGLASLVLPTIQSAAGWSFGNTALVLVSALFMLPSPISQLLYPANPPAWSLLYEFFTNALFAMLLVRLRLRWVISLAIVGATVFVAMAWQAQGTNLGYQWSGMIGGVARATFAFTFGIVLARVDPAARRRVGWIAALPVAMVLGPIICSQSFVVDLVTILIVMPIAVAIAARSELPAALRPGCIWLGDLSYPLYVIHYPLLVLIHRAATEWQLSAMAETALFLVLTATAARLLLPLDSSVRRRLSVRLVDRERRLAIQEA